MQNETIPSKHQIFILMDERLNDIHGEKIIIGGIGMIMEIIVMTQL